MISYPPTHPPTYLSEYCVLVVKMRLRRIGKEELAPIGVGAIVSHGHHPSLVCTVGMI